MTKRLPVFFLVLALLLGCFSVPMASAEAKDVYIDNTVDNSVTYITGYVTVKNTDTGEYVTAEVFSASENVTYSNPKPAAVYVAIDMAVLAVHNYIDEKGYVAVGEFAFSEKTGKVWDNRKYTTIEDGDAVLIGDSDYLTGAYGVNENYTRTHIASGDYGKETFISVVLDAQCVPEPTTYSVTVSKTGSGTVTVTPDSPAEGDTVTIAMKADAGWALDTFGVSGTLAAGVYGDSGITEDTVSFKAPAQDVVVNVSFKQLPAPTPTPAPTAAPTAAPTSAPTAVPTTVPAPTPKPAKRMCYDQTVSSLGIRYRDIKPGLTEKWFMFTPLNLSQNGQTELDLIAANASKVGTVTVRVQDGILTIDYAVFGGVEVSGMGFALLPSLDEVSDVDAIDLSRFSFGQEISVADDLGGDPQVLLQVMGRVTYDYADPRCAPFSGGSDAYHAYAEALLPLMD